MINELSRQFMRNYFTCEQGVKIRVGFMWRYDGKFYPVGYNYHKGGMNSLLDQDFINFRTIHSFNFIFDKKVLMTESWNVARESIVGVGCVMDVDSPKITGSNNRYDCLLQNHAIERFEEVRGIVKEELIEINEWDQCRMMFSGNGIYFILRDIYEDVEGTTDAFLGLCDDVNSLIPEDIVDSGTVYKSNKFNKVPFTMHYRYDRLAIPLDKQVPITREYLIKNSGLDCDVEKVIGDCKW